MSNEKVSKPGTVGEDMAGELALQERFENYLRKLHEKSRPQENRRSVCLSNMPPASEGDLDNKGPMSVNYIGNPRNADRPKEYRCSVCLSNMPPASEGDLDNESAISANYGPPPRKADPPNLQKNLGLLISAGRQDNKGSFVRKIMENYEGKPRNADPPHLNRCSVCLSNMPPAWEGDLDNNGPMSENYNGNSRNADRPREYRDTISLWNMPPAWEGDLDNKGPMSANYNGNPRNADPPHLNRRSVCLSNLPPASEGDLDNKGPMSTAMSNEKVSKPGTVGENMAGALARRELLENYLFGKLLKVRNADRPQEYRATISLSNQNADGALRCEVLRHHYTPSLGYVQTKDFMKEARQESAEKERERN